MEGNGRTTGGVARIAVAARLEPVGERRGAVPSQMTAPEQPQPEKDPTTGFLPLVLGLVGLAIGALVDAIREVTHGPDEVRTPEAGADGLLGQIPAAALALTVEMVGASAHLAFRAAQATRPIVGFAADHTPLGGPLRVGREWLDTWSRKGRVEQDGRERFASSVVEALIPRVMESVDLNAIVEQVDVAGLVGKVDIEQIVERLDIDAIVARVDIGRIVDRLDMDAVASRINIDAIAARVDVQAILERVNIQSIVDRVDLPTITRQVMDEVDVGEIIRESTGSLTTEAVDAMRYQGMNADRFVSRVVDRVLMRKGGRSTTLPDPGDGAGGAAPADGPAVDPAAPAEDPA
jgi:hypothetical protein